MMECKFNKGDRIIVTSESCGYRHRVGKAGYIISDVPFSRSVCIEFDEPFKDGHDGGGLGEDYHCYWIDPEGIELFCEEPAYEFKAGASLSFDELMESEKERDE